jgi:hypothetical protein
MRVPLLLSLLLLLGHFNNLSLAEQSNSEEGNHIELFFHLKLTHFQPASIHSNGYGMFSFSEIDLNIFFMKIEWK